MSLTYHLQHKYMHLKDYVLAIFEFLASAN